MKMNELPQIPESARRRTMSTVAMAVKVAVS
jgi:hypothetical protein